MITNSIDSSAGLFRRFIAIACIVWLFGVTPIGAKADEPKDPAPLTVPATELQRLFESGNALFRSGMELYKTDRPAAEAKFREAAGAWRQVARSGNIHNAELQNNIANASIFAGDLPGAIVAYRRALAIDPSNSRAQAGLAAARKSAGTEALVLGAPVNKDVNAGGFRGAMTVVGASLGRIAQRAETFASAKTMLAIAAGCYVGFFAAVIVRVIGWKRIHGAILAALLVSATAIIVPLALHEANTLHRDEAVVLNASEIARNGPAEMYDPVFKEPLRAGLEVHIDEVRGEWVKIRLRDGRSAWVRADSLELI